MSWFIRRNSRPDDPASPGRCKALSVLANTLHVKGAVTCAGELHVEGVIEGEAAADSVTLGRHGTIIGMILADRAVICGTVHGLVRANMVELTATARIYGTLEYGRLIQEPGAQIMPPDAPDAPAVADDLSA